MQMRLSRGIGAWRARRRCMTKSLAGLVHLAAGSSALGDVDCSGPASARCSRSRNPPLLRRSDPPDSRYDRTFLRCLRAEARFRGNSL